MNKYFITAEALLIDSFALARQIVESGFRPHFIVGIWRGGSPVGIAVQEYLLYRGVETDHIAIRTSSYYGIDQQHREVRVHGLDYVVNNLEAEMDLLIVDDVFDSGRSIEAVIQEIQRRAGPRAPGRIVVACPWYKPSRNVTGRQPDFYVHSSEEWLVFPHELVGLSEEEIVEGKGARIAEVLGFGEG